MDTKLEPYLVMMTLACFIGLSYVLLAFAYGFMSCDMFYMLFVWYCNVFHLFFVPLQLFLYAFQMCFICFSCVLILFSQVFSSCVLYVFHMRPCQRHVLQGRQAGVCARGVRRYLLVTKIFKIEGRVY